MTHVVSPRFSMTHRCANVYFSAGKSDGVRSSGGFVFLVELQLRAERRRHHLVQSHVDGDADGGVGQLVDDAFDVARLSCG